MHGPPRVVVITGASAGLGRATARLFARNGSDVALLARGTDGLEAAKREVEAFGRRALVLPTDVARADRVEAGAEAVERELGPIDVWINNAMVSVFSPVSETPAEEFQRVTDVTYMGCVHGTLSALRRMLPRDRGVIVQVGSALCYRAVPLLAPYCAAKHAIKGFTEALRCELLHDESRVRVTLVHPPAMNTPHFGWTRNRLPREAQPVPPIFQPELGARAIHWAAHHDRREVWVGGPTVLAILASRIAPGFADRVLARKGYAGQQTDEPARTRADNLWEPVPGDHGARGRFDGRARTFSLQWWSTFRR